MMRILMNTCVECAGHSGYRWKGTPLDLDFGDFNANWRLLEVQVKVGTVDLR